MKAKDAFVVPIYGTPPNSIAEKYIVVFDNGRGDSVGEFKREVKQLEYAGEFRLRTYAEKFAQMLKDGAA